MKVKENTWLIIFFASLWFLPVGARDGLISVVNSFINHLGSHKPTVNIINAMSIDRCFVDDVLKNASSQLKTALELTDPDYTNNMISETKLSFVIFAENFEDVYSFFNSFSPKIFDIRGYFLIVISSSLQRKEIGKIYNFIWKAKIFNLNILHEESGEVYCTTFVPFKEDSCDGKLTNETFVTRKFSTGRKETFFPKLLNDMKNCPVRVSTFQNSAFVIKKGNLLSGRDIDLINTISKALNFTLDLQLVEGGEPWGYLYENGTGTGAIAKLLNNETDLIFGDYFLKLDRLTWFDNTVAYFTSRLVYVIPPSAPFSSFQKLSAPFRKNVWISLLAFYTMATLSILVIKRLSVEVKNIVFGSKAHYPFTNMILITLGMSQRKEPRGRFARTVFILFLMFCLVIRSVYQGSLYRFLQSDGPGREIKSFDDLIKKDFKFYIGTGFKEMGHSNPEFYRRRVIVSSGFPKIFKQFSNPYFKGTFITPGQNIAVLNKEQTYNITFQILSSEVFATVSVVMYHNKDFFLAPAINEVIQKLQSGGVILHLHYRYFKRIQKQREGDTRKPLNVGHLFGAFEILFGGSVIALAIFIVELIFGKKNNFYKRN